MRTHRSPDSRTTSKAGRAAAAAALLLAGTIVLASPADARELTVTTTADGGAGSLRAAVDAANASDDADVIVLQAGAEYVLSSCTAGELASTTGPLTIVGNGATIRQTCAGARLLRNTGPGLLTVQNVTLTGGDGATDGGAILSNAGPVAIIGSTVAGNRAAGDGGGVFVDGGTKLTIEQSAIRDNQAYDYGGGIGVFGELQMTQSLVENNSVSGFDAFGGGIYVNPQGAANARIVGSTVRGNHADGASALGGGIYVDADTLVLDTSTVADNTAGSDGGGIYAYFDTTITRSTISGNTAGGRGGGVFSYDTSLEVRNSTVVANTAASTGGGVFSEGFGVTVDFATFSANSSPGGAQLDLGGGTLTAFGTVFADAAGGPACVSVVANSEGHNLEQGGATCGLRAATDVVSAASAGLGALGANGGPTLTEAPAATSPLLDAIPAVNPRCTGVDERGVPRPQGVGCDIGAVELTVIASTGSAPGAPLAFVG